mmetsp:Transcript_26930/g.81249  ORF Transcript_26930/g.81249 Transcript_26930/m.81249 type:complete len:249 (+) Transcript_26930:494-1240(+)
MRSRQEAANPFNVHAASQSVHPTFLWLQHHSRLAWGHAPCCRWPSASQSYAAAAAVVVAVAGHPSPWASQQNPLFSAVHVSVVPAAQSSGAGSASQTSSMVQSAHTAHSWWIAPNETLQLSLCSGKRFSCVHCTRARQLAATPLSSQILSQTVHPISCSLQHHSRFSRGQVGATDWSKPQSKRLVMDVVVVELESNLDLIVLVDKSHARPMPRAAQHHSSSSLFQSSDWPAHENLGATADVFVGQPFW